MLRFGLRGSFRFRRWSRRCGMSLSGTRACARCLRSATGWRGRRLWLRRMRGRGYRVGRLEQASLRGGCGGGVSAGLILRASYRCVGMCLRCPSTSMCCCLCCTTLRRTGGRCLCCCATLRAAMRRAGLPVQYADYTLWQRAVLGEEGDGASALVRQLGYWRDRLAGLPEELALPFDHERPAVASYRWGTVPLDIGADLHAGLLGLARASGASLFMVLQACLAGLLSRLGAGADIAIGSPIAGRTDSALDELVGFFVNTLVLRTDTSGDPSVRGLIGRVRAGNLSAYSHQDVPFERLVEELKPARSLSRHPLFQVMLVLQNTAPAVFEVSGVDASFEAVELASAKFDLCVSVSERRGSDGSAAGLVGGIEYASDLFERASVAGIGGRLIRVLRAAG